MTSFLKTILLAALLAVGTEVAGQATTPPLPANEGNNQANPKGKKKETKEDKDKDKTKENNLPPTNIFGSDDSRKHKQRTKK